MELGRKQIRTIIFLYRHNKERFTFGELHQFRFFSSQTALSKFLQWAVKKGVFKCTRATANGKRYSCYEISSWGNDFAEQLKYVFDDEN